MNTTDSRSSHPPIGLLLIRLDRLIEERFAEALGGHGATRRQWQLLNLIEEGGATVDELAEGLAPFLDRAAGESVREHLDPLVHQGLLGLEGERCSLTETGRDRLEALARDVRAVRERTAAGLSESEYAAVMAGLRKMIRNLET
ncbi:MAG TPA: MarR family winged helix-turn-helix transcriptional regulator [Glycomyces sp.]|nr:MarR family winged helix-turn-helix transcriptional regulator [Glycomyces sp.]